MTAGAVAGRTVHGLSSAAFSAAAPMVRPLIAVLAALFVSAGAGAQSSLVPSRTGVAVGGSYAGVVSTPAYGDEPGVPGATLDLTYGPLSAGLGLAFDEYDTAVSVGAGFHVARNVDAQLTTTVGATLQLLEDDRAFLIPSLTHSRRLVGAPGVSVVPGASLGMAFPVNTDVQSQVGVVASGQVSLLLGRGPVVAVTPSVALAAGGAEVVTAGVAAGLVLSGRERRSGTR